VTSRVLQGDCRDVLAGMAAGSFDLCIADPPYGDTSLEWDRPVIGWIPAVARVLKPNASIWMFGSLRHFMTQRIAARMRACGFRYAQDIIWEKQNGTGFHNDRFKRVHELAVQFYRGDWADQHHAPQFTADATARTVRRKTRPTHTGHIEAGHYESQDGGPRLMRSVIYARNEHGRAIHPTQKPLDILLPLIRFSCPPGGVILDPMCGSGSTLLAAEVAGFEAVGIEVHPGRAETAQTWLAGGTMFAEEVAA
jgi:site-specific DNA-methyltransferase (adenine-specific)